MRWKMLDCLGGGRCYFILDNGDGGVGEGPLSIENPICHGLVDCAKATILLRGWIDYDCGRGDGIGCLPHGWVYFIAVEAPPRRPS